MKGWKVFKTGERLDKKKDRLDILNTSLLHCKNSKKRQKDNLTEVNGPPF